MKIRFKKGLPYVKEPIRSSTHAAGWDIIAPHDHIIFPGKTDKICTYLYVEIPNGYYGALYNRSSMGGKGLIIPNSVGVIDADYRGCLYVPFWNVTDKEYTIKMGDKIAQLVVHKFEELDFEEAPELSVTERGDKGLGSTGR